ncbi:MAG: hypothetical protein ACR2FO_08765 [Actinomycetota bacterium]
MVKKKNSPKPNDVPPETADPNPRRWESILASAARLQELVPNSVLVGGTAAAHYAGHRESHDHDHVLGDLKNRFDEVLGVLELTQGWATERVNRPVLILGSLDGVETGIRQLIRQRPLEVEEVEIEGHRIRIPTLEEMVRVKAWLILRRNATRDYLDFVALADRLGKQAAQVALSLDDYYSDQIGPGGARVATQLVKQLAEPAPYDLSEVDLKSYRRLLARWQDWGNVAKQCRGIATQMLGLVNQKGPP